jgi:hypothetical protein
MISAQLYAQIDTALHRDYIVAGDALARVREGKSWQPEYPNFRECARHKFGLGGSTADEYIAAANVAHDLPHDVRLPQRAARLLFPFDRETRIKAARHIVANNLTIRQTKRHVLDLHAADEPRRTR